MLPQRAQALQDKVDSAYKAWSEADPHGKDAHSPGAKLDAGKNDLDLVLGAFAGALLEVGKVGTYGARKYTRNGWREVPNGIGRYSSAMLRHYFLEFQELRDADTDLLHAAHLAWNALARLQLMLDMTIPQENHEPKFESTESLPSTQETVLRFFKGSPQVQKLFLFWADRNIPHSERTAWENLLQDQLPDVQRSET